MERIRTPALVLACMPAVVLVGFALWKSLEARSGPGPGGLEGSPASIPAQVHPQLVAGIEALRAGRPDEARQHLRQLPADDPYYPLAVAQLVTVAEQLEGSEAALDHLRAIAERRPQDPELQVQLAQLCHRSGRYEEAQKAALHALRLAPERISMIYQIALDHVAQGDLENAIEFYELATSKDPGGVFFFDAWDDLRRYQAEHPAEPSPHYALSYFAHRLDLAQQAREELERYLAMNPQGPAAETARQRLLEMTRAGGT